MAMGCFRALATTSGAFALFLLSSLPTPAMAETNEVRFAQLYSLTYLPAYIVYEEKLIEKHAVRLGIPAPNVTISKLSSGPAANAGPTCAIEIHGSCVPTTHYWAAFRLAGGGFDQQYLKSMGLRRIVADGLIERWMLNVPCGLQAGEPIPVRCPSNAGRCRCPGWRFCSGPRHSRRVLCNRRRREHSRRGRCRIY